MIRRITIFSVLRRNSLFINASNKKGCCVCQQHLCKNNEQAHLTHVRHVSTGLSSAENNIDYLVCSDKDTYNILSKDMKIIYDFISEEEESNILKEIEPYFKRLKYESSHWDDVSFPLYSIKYMSFSKIYQMKINKSIFSKFMNETLPNSKNIF